MTNISEFARFVHGQLADLGEVNYGRFFGGVGFKLGDVQFAMCMSDTLYFVVDDTTRAKYVESGSMPFQYGTAKGTRLVHRYYEVPADVLEERDSLTAWAQAAVSVAMRPKNPRKPKPRPNSKVKLHAKAQPNTKEAKPNTKASKKPKPSAKPKTKQKSR
jgi:DNA transformation protein and related proteins